MFNTIEINKKRQLGITLHPATVIHADKYTDSFTWSGRWGRSPYPGQRVTEVVFRSKQDGRDWRITVENINLPIYTSQDVTVIAADDAIVGYIDTQTKEYYYTTGNFAYELDFGVPLYISVLLGLGLCALSFFLLPGDDRGYSLIPIAFAILFHIIQRRIWNHRIEKALNSYLESE